MDERKVPKKMKITSKIFTLILVFLIMLPLTACGEEAPNELTYEEAMAIAQAWLDDHPDLSAYFNGDWSYDPYEIPPPTYSLFGTQYYEFILSSNGEEAEDAWYSHIILVPAETGELLSMYCDIRFGVDWLYIEDVYVTLLDDWYNGGHATYPPARVTAQEALAVYAAWRDDHFDDDSYFSDITLNEELYGTYVIFGEPYYYFKPETGMPYWYNILVHMETGELLFVEMCDGMFWEEYVMPLDDWFNECKQYYEY